MINPGDTIYLPPQSEQVEHEAELTVVIGRRGRWIRPCSRLVLPRSGPLPEVLSWDDTRRWPEHSARKLLVAIL